MISAVELAGMRAQSADALPDTCEITRDGGPGTLNTETGVVTPALASPVFIGACRLRPVDGQETDTEVGSLHETLGRYVVTLPHDADGILVDDLLTVTDSFDADLVDRPMRVLHVGWSGYQIDRRIIVRDFEQP